MSVFLIDFVDKSLVEFYAHNFRSEGFSGTCAWWLSHVSVKVNFQSSLSLFLSAQ